MRQSRTTLLLGLSALAFAAGAVRAQDAKPAGDNSAQDRGAIADIIVTAQKKSENLQNVPISVAAVTGQAVSALHATTLQGLQGTVPNISIGNFSNTPDNAVFTIRGIGIIEPDPYAGNTVSIVSDGVPQYFSMGALMDLYDVDRIEILRGPQGTLFGANTTGGVVNIVNAQPTGQYGGKLDIGYGNHDHFNAAGAINIPITQDLFSRLSISHDQHEGFVTNVVDGKKLGRRDVTLFRGALKYAPAGNFSATLSGEYDMGRNGSPIVVAGDLPGEAEFVAAGVQGMYQSPCQPNRRCVAPGAFYSALSGVPNKSNMDTERVNLTLSLKHTAVGDITSITGYRHFKLFEYTDQDGTPLFLDDTRRTTHGWQISEELRTDVNLSKSINMIAGAFYMGTHYDHEQDFRIQFAAPGLFQRNLQDQGNWSGSVFAQVYAHLTDQLRLQAGVRYTHESTNMLASTATSINLSGMTDFDGTGNLALGTVAPPRGSKSWDNVGWKLGLDYKVTPDALLYAYWARGFKSGGFTGRIGIAQDLGPYNPEHVDTYEAGMKTDFLDRHLRVNLSAFFTNYRDMQLAQIYFLGSGSSIVQGNTILNAASSHIKGFEGEVVAAPLPGLTLKGSLAYLSAKYSKFPFLLPSGAIQDLSGQRLQNAPSWSGAASATYEFPLAGDMKARANVQYTYASEKLQTSIIDTPRARVQPQHLVNANLDLLVTPSMTVGLWARNLFNKHYINSVFDAPGTLGLTNYAPPLEWGVAAGYKF